LLNSDSPGANAARGKGRGRELRGTLVFLPSVHLHGNVQFFTQAAFFERGDNEYWVAGTRTHEAEKTLAKDPTKAAEVVKRRTGSDNQRVEFRRPGRTGHELLSLIDPFLKFSRSNGMNADI